MRIVGYVRERPMAVGAEPAFAQGERLRRWAADHGHELVALCQDHVVPGDPEARPGLRAAQAVVASGAASLLAVASLDALGDDDLEQEVVCWEVRRIGGDVTSTDPADTAALGTEAPSERRIAREALARLEAHRRRMGG